jgi:hypothetical protein
VNWYRSAVAVGTVDLPTLLAVDRFVKTCERDSTWGDVQEADMACGDFAASVVRLKVPSGVSRSLTLVNIVSGDYSQATGYQGNGTNKYKNTGMNLAALGYSESNLGLWVYARNTEQNVGVTAYMLGARSTAGSNDFSGVLRSSGGRDFGLIAATNGQTTGTATGRTGFLGVTCNGSRAAQYYDDGVAIGATTTMTGTLYSGNLFQFAANIGGVPGSYANRNLSSRFTTLGMSAARVALFSAAVIAFETALGRNV